MIVALLAAVVVGLATSNVLGVFLVFLAALAAAAPGIEFLDRRWRAKTLREMQTVADDIQRLIHNASDPAEELAPVVVAESDSRGTSVDEATGDEAKGQFLDLDTPRAASADSKRADQVKDRL
jgi:hypothetical protein